MSQDGSWTDPEPHPGGEAFVPRSLPEPIKLPGTERTPEERVQELSRELELRNAWIRQNRETLKQAEQRAEMLGAIVAALVQKHGENVGTSEAPRYRVALTEAELVALERGHISVNLDPMSGALLLRFRPE